MERNHWQEDQEEIKQNIFKTYGWFFLTKQIADYYNKSPDDIYPKPAREVFSIVQVMKAEEQFKSYGK